MQYSFTAYLFIYHDFYVDVDVDMDRVPFHLIILHLAQLNFTIMESQWTEGSYSYWQYSLVVWHNFQGIFEIPYLFSIGAKNGKERFAVTSIHTEFFFSSK